MRETLRDYALPALGLSVTEAARQVAVTPTALSRVLEARAAVAPDMARYLEARFGADRGGRAQAWLELQMADDVWQTRPTVSNRVHVTVRRLFAMRNRVRPRLPSRQPWPQCTSRS